MTLHYAIIFSSLAFCMALKKKNRNNKQQNGNTTVRMCAFCTWKCSQSKHNLSGFRQHDGQTDKQVAHKKKTNKQQQQ